MISEFLEISGMGEFSNKSSDKQSLYIYDQTTINRTNRIESTTSCSIYKGYLFSQYSNKDVVEIPERK